jgi:hypothetical protein
MGCLPGCTLSLPPSLPPPGTPPRLNGALTIKGVLSGVEGVFTLPMGDLPSGRNMTISLSCVDSLGRSLSGTSESFIVDASPPLAAAYSVVVSAVSPTSSVTMSPRDVETTQCKADVIVDTMDLSPVHRYSSQAQVTVKGWGVPIPLDAVSNSTLVVSWLRAFKDPHTPIVNYTVVANVGSLEVARFEVDASVVSAQLNLSQVLNASMVVLDDHSDPRFVGASCTVPKGLSFTVTATNAAGLSAAVTTPAVVLDVTPPEVLSTPCAMLCDGHDSNEGSCIAGNFLAPDETVLAARIGWLSKCTRDVESGVVGVQQRLVTVGPTGALAVTQPAEGLFAVHSLQALNLTQGAVVVLQLRACNPWGMCSDFVSTGGWV